MAGENDDNELLTDEERASLAAEEGEEIDGSASLTGEDSQDWIDSGWGAASNQADDADDADEPDNEDAEAAKAADDTPSPEDKAEPVTGEIPSEKRERAPVDTSQYDQQIEELRQQEAALFDKYDDGDLSRDEFQQQKAEIAAKADDVVEQRAIAKKQISDETAQWDGAVADYFKQYEGLKDDKVISAFDAEVRAVTSNPAFASKSFADQLAIAHKRLVTTAEDMGLEGVPEIKGREKAAAANPGPKAKEPQKGDEGLGKPPQTLARVPASDMNDAGDSKYAALERLVNSGAEPEEIEQALQQLTPRERDQFSSMIV